MVGDRTLNRDTAVFKNAIGMFSRLRPVQFHADMDMNFATLVKTIGAELNKVYPDMGASPGKINRPVGVGKKDRRQLFDVIVSLEKWDFSIHFDGHPVEFVPLSNPFESPPLAVTIKEHHSGEGREVRVDFVYHLAVFEEAEIKK